MAQNTEIQNAQKIKRCHEYVEALEQEQKKIQVFKRELPLCLELVTQAIEACRRELSDQSECSEQTTSVCDGPVFEEFIPTKTREEDQNDDVEHDSPQAPDDGCEVDQKKSDWLRSVQLWNNNPSPEPNPRDVSLSSSSGRVVLPKKAKVVEVKPNNGGGAFQPFQKDKKRVFSEVDDLQPKAATTTSSTTGTGEEDQQQKQTHRKQRRCWSPELHRRFLHALQQLGGSHVATPKQIRDLMKVDGLTNDEVKSHLQKYRLHTRRPATTAQSNTNLQQPQFVVVGGVWVPPPRDFPPSMPNVANDGGSVCAPVAAVQPQSPKRSVERSSGRCNSPDGSSSINTATTSSSRPVS